MAMLKEVRTGSPARTGAAVRLDPIENMGIKPGLRAGISASSLFMSDSIEGLNVGPLSRSLVAGPRARVDAAGRRMVVKRGGTVFTQGEHHDGIFIVKTRRFICGPRTACRRPCLGRARVQLLDEHVPPCAPAKSNRSARRKVRNMARRKQRNI